MCTNSVTIARVMVADVSLHCSLSSRLCEERTVTAHKRPFGQKLVAFMRDLILFHACTQIEMLGVGL